MALWYRYLAQWKIEHRLHNALGQNKLYMALFDLVLRYAASLHRLGYD
jgi:hypothetical protein